MVGHGVPTGSFGTEIASSANPSAAEIAAQRRKELLLALQADNAVRRKRIAAKRELLARMQEMADQGMDRDLIIKKMKQLAIRNALLAQFDNKNA